MMQTQEIGLPSGTRLRGHYRIEYTLSKGGFGKVYLATDLTNQGKVAIKEADYSDPQTEEQFAVEARVLIAHNLKGVVRGYDAFTENGRFYLVMAYIAGDNVEEMQIAHFKRFQRPLPEHMSLMLMALICAATQELHDQKVLHRDIKPANIKVEQSGQPILLDLGLAKLDPATHTLLAAQAYTPGYAPPEQCQEGGITTERTDVYALGATTYYTLTGRQPWDAVKRLIEVQQGHSDMPTPRDHCPWISPTTEAVVMQALALDPDHRFSSARAMQRALEHAYQALGPTALCAACHALNPAGAEYCGDCGAALKQAPPQSQQAVLMSAVAPADVPTQILPPKRQNAAQPLPSRPEPMLTPRPLLPRRRVAFLARIALWLSILALLVPVAGQIFALFVVTPLALAARGHVARSGGTLRGMGRANIALGLALLNVIGSIVLVYLVVTGKLHPFG
jgi:ribosomal protein L40E